MTISYQDEDWFIALQNAVAEESQAAVAKRVDISKTAISQVLNGTYKGSIKNIQEKVEGALLSHAVICPILDEITTDICAGHRTAKYSPNNPVRVKLYRACKTCQHNPANQGE